MRILYLHQYYNTPEMSGSTRSHEMGRRLVAKGCDVVIVTSYREGDKKGGWFTTEEDGVVVHWLPVPYCNKLGYLSRIWAFLKFALRSSFKAMSIKADIVFATSTPLTIFFPGFIASRVRRIPMVFEVRDLWPEMPIAVGALNNGVLARAAGWLERRAYFSSKRVVALSPGMADGVAATGYDRARIHVIPNSCDLELFDPNTQELGAFRRKHSEIGDRPMLVYAGTLGRVNGVSYFVRLAAVVARARPDIRFVVIGGGAPKRRKCGRRLRRPGCWENRFLCIRPFQRRKCRSRLRMRRLRFRFSLI